MRHLSAAARLWIGVVLGGGCVALVLAGVSWSQLELIQPTFWVFLLLACIAHAFPAVAPRHPVYHPTPAFLMAAVLLVSWPAVALIVLAAHATEWVRRPRPWYIQLYNIAVYLLSAGAAMSILALLQAVPFTLAQPGLIVAALIAAAVLLIVDHGLTAIGLLLARRVSFADSGLFGRESLGLDGTLLVVGIAMAGGWRVQPLSLLVTAAPLTLIYRAVRLVDVETGSHRDQLGGLDNQRNVSDFIATAAHELRTPLTALQGYAELLRNEVEPAQRDRWLRILQVQASQLGELVDQLLDVSRLDSGRFHAERRAFELVDVVQRVMQEFADQAVLGGHQLECNLVDVPPVYADPAQVERILRNLVSNAIKYSPSGGPINIAAAKAARGGVEVRVEDRGLGIPAEWLGRLFERFQRVDLPERVTIRGTGLGLYIARQLVELNGGRIWATSEGIDRGSAFHFTVPRAPLGEY